MKRFLMTVASLGLMSMASVAHAINLECWIDNDGGQDNHALLIVDELKGNCEGYLMEMSGIGVGLRVSGNNFAISCPFQSDPRGTYLGTKVQAGMFIVDLAAAVFIGDGLCFLTGIGGGIGA